MLLLLKDLCFPLQILLPAFTWDMSVFQSLSFYMTGLWKLWSIPDLKMTVIHSTCNVIFCIINVLWIITI